MGLRLSVDETAQVQADGEGELEVGVGGDALGRDGAPGKQHLDTPTGERELADRQEASLPLKRLSALAPERAVLAVAPF